MPERAKGGVLMHPMEIEHRIDACFALRQFRFQPPLDTAESRDRRIGFRRRRQNRFARSQGHWLVSRLWRGRRLCLVRQSFTAPRRHAAGHSDPKLYFFIRQGA
jgi:hypothetical protein